MFKQSIILIVIVLSSLTGAAQSSSTPLKDRLSRIGSVPVWYTLLYEDDSLWKSYRFNKPVSLKGVDTKYADIVKKGKRIIPQLVTYLSDSTLTTIPNSCDSGFITIGQLAFFLINDIEYIPVRVVTRKQWDGMGRCLIILPDGWLAYLRENGKKFEKLYRKYFYSKQRQQFLKGNL